MTFSE